MEQTANKLKWYRPKQIKTMVFAALLFFCSSCIVANTTNSVLPIFAGIRGWNYSTMSMLVGIAILVSVVFAIVFGRIIAKIGSKPVILCSLALGIISAVIYGTATSFSLFVICIFVNAIAAAGYQTVGVTALINMWFPRTKGIVLGWVTMGIVLSDVLWIPFMPKIITAVGPQKAFIGFAVLMLLVGIFGLFFIKDTPEADNTYPDGDISANEDLQMMLKMMKEYKSPFTIGKTLRTRQTWQIVFGWGLLWLVAIAYLSQEVARFATLGYSLEFGSNLMGIGGFFGLAGSWFFGFLDQKLGTKKATIIYCIWVIVVLCLAFLHPVSKAFIYITCFAIACALGGICNLIPSMTGTVFGRWDFPSANAVISPLTLALCAIGIFLGGFFAGGPGYTVMYIVLLVVMVIATIIVLTTKETLIGKNMEKKGDQHEK